MEDQRIKKKTLFCLGVLAWVFIPEDGSREVSDQQVTLTTQDQ